MKEIDFLPEWYKSGRRKQVTCRAQYLAMAGVTLIMLTWILTASASVWRGKVELKRLTEKAVTAKNVLDEISKTEKLISTISEKTNMLEKIDSRINVAAVLAELSFLIDERIAVTKVELTAEKLDLGKENESKKSSRVRVFTGAAGQKNALDPVRFKVTINGMAPDAHDVANLVCKLENSEYFQLVVPSISPNKTLKGLSEPVLRDDNSRKNVLQPEINVSEFKIDCYLANYSQAGKQFAKKSQE